jgi:FkbM family methyltransferase
MKTHQFDNGIQVYESHLLDVQKARYAKRNVHEHDEEDIFTDIIYSLPDSGCYVNVGTAIGYYPMLARKIRPDLRIHCFEPLPRHMDFFRDNMKLNGFSEKDFNLHEVAVSTAPGRAFLKDKSYDSLLVRDVGEPSVIEVEAIALADVFDLILELDVGLLQMDIQGHEAAVLGSYFSRNRARPGDIQSFLVGTHWAKVHDSCRQMFIENGYVLHIDEPAPVNQPDGILFCRMMGSDMCD